MTLPKILNMKGDDAKLPKTGALLKKQFRGAFAKRYSQRFPTGQKLDQILFQHSTRRLELSVATAIQKLSIFIQDGNRRNAFIQGNFVFLHEFRVLFTFADVDVYQQVL